MPLKASIICAGFAKVLLNIQKLYGYSSYLEFFFFNINKHINKSKKKEKGENLERSAWAASQGSTEAAPKVSVPLKILPSAPPPPAATPLVEAMLARFDCFPSHLNTFTPSSNAAGYRLSGASL